MQLSLISNSGIQFHRFELLIDPNAEVISTMGFHEYEDLINARVSIETAYFLPDQDFWIPKAILKHHNYISADDKILSDSINIRQIKGHQLIEEKDYFTISDINSCLKHFVSTDENLIWLPIPYFKNLKTFGPIAWARMMLKEIPSSGGNNQRASRQQQARRYNVVLAFDTALANLSGSYYAPTEADINEEGNRFALCNNEDLLLNFCNAKYDCDWVRKYIKKLVIKGDSEPQEFPRQKYIGYYIYFIKYLASLVTSTDHHEAESVFPKVVLHSDQQVPVEVDLILDIGNSNTCGILFERPDTHKPFSFTNVKKLTINDLTHPEKAYSEPFSMRLVFTETRFGNMDTLGHKSFRWPSLLRLGREAGRLISQNAVNKDRGIETASHHSSPKRYLWDNRKADVAWEFINFSGNNLREAIYYEGISEQFKADGEFASDGEPSFSPYYSRRSLMVFVFVEILLNAISQVNSHEFRGAHGNSETPRKIKRLTITCPTSIIQKEQVILRECAQTAVKVLGRFFSDTFLGNFNEDETVPNLEIVPSPKDLARKRDQAAFRKDWIYDEATCGQFVFLYGEICKRYLNDAETFFRLHGRFRDDVTYTDARSLTVGSIDIGGGTTDVMICAYQYEPGQNMTVLKPHPLYWESFNLAGDDLLKEIVQQVLLGGTPDTEEAVGSMGVLPHAAKKAGVTDIPKKMLHFFGSDSNRQSYTARIYRKNFVVQIAIPIALRYLQHSIEDLPDEELAFNDFFADIPANPELVQFFNQSFAPLKLDSVKFKLSKKRVNEIVELTFDPMLRQLSGMLSAFGCDFVLLAGKPTTLPKIREMLVRYYPVSPDRIITLSKKKYRVGRWYPFADDLGYIEDSKTIVSVGAAIALMGGRLDGLDGFRINTEFLRKRLGSTADYIGLLDPHTQLVDPFVISPEENIADMEVFGLPMTFGYKQLPNKNYRAKPIYKLDWNNDEIRRRILDQNPSLAGNEQDVVAEIQREKMKLSNVMPLRVRLQRNWSESKEMLTISRIMDSGRNDRSKQLLALSVMTLADEHSYWLDTGEFVLNLR